MSFAGLTASQINRVQRTLGVDALDQIKKNPYILSRLFPLKVVDGVAAAFKVLRDGNIHRAVAVAEYELDRALMDGHCYVHAHTLTSKAKAACKLKQLDPDQLTAHDTIVLEGKYAALKPIYAAEVFVAGAVNALLGEPSSVGATWFDDPTLEVDESQRAAIKLLLEQPLGVITGAPGTGKTTCTRVALQALDDVHITYELCAPTGKAARRLSEVTSRPARTIHRLLGWTPQGWTFNQYNHVDTNLVVVDEASMLDIRLAADLLAAVDPRKTRIVFIGDVDQLPPVGPGAFLQNLIESESVPVERLTRLHRAAANSWICRNAPLVLTGRGVDLDADVSDYLWYEVQTADVAGIQSATIAAIQKLLDEGCSWDDFQVIVPMKIREAGATQLNQAIRSELKQLSKPTAQIGWNDESVLVGRGDRVIQTRNNYELDVFNGECGEVAVVETPSRMRVRFGDEYRIYTNAALKDLSLAYALTVHKVQGSEWSTVIVICHSVHGRMLNRRLLYTALTRAKQRVVIIGDERGVMQAIRGVNDVARRTMLVQRIKG